MEILKKCIYYYYFRTFKRDPIVGFGRIGQSLIKRCKGFEMKVKVFDPFVNKETIERFGGQKIENLEDGLKICDYVSLHVPLNEKTKNLIDYSKLKK